MPVTERKKNHSFIFLYCSVPLLFQCDHCLPLYNDKPFQQGDQVNAFNCKPCQCNNHSRSCHYNISVDPFPFEHHRGGGGVCEDCEHNTTGN